MIVALIDLIFPRYCLECRKQGAYICANCLEKVRKASFVCPFCKSFSYGGIAHPSCRSNTELTRSVAIWRYEGVVRKAILALKYKFASDVAAELVTLASANLNGVEVFNHSDLVPIPLYLDRLRWRGFNQAELLGKMLAQNLNLRFEPTLLVRTRSTTPQASLHKRERLRNMRGVFAVNEDLKVYIKGKRIVLFDDVWTTGATFEEAAKELLKNGAMDVSGLAIAR